MPTGVNMRVKMKRLNIFVTEFVKTGFPHTSILPTLTIHNFRLVKGIDLKFGQQQAQT